MHTDLGVRSVLPFAKSTPMKTIVIKHYIAFGALVAALIAFCPLQTRADTIALSFTGGTSAFPNTDLTLGWAFTLSSPVLLTALGLWDQNNDGLSVSHAVAIFTSTATLEAQVTIPSGTGATLTNGFRYVSFAPVVLPAGSYTIAGFISVGSEEFAGAASAITTAPGVTYAGSRSEFGFAFPPGDVATTSNSYFGPNFQFTTPTSVRDAGTIGSLFGLSLMGLAFLRRKIPA
jgi:hypothetical protein